MWSLQTHKITFILCSGKYVFNTMGGNKNTWQNVCNIQGFTCVYDYISRSSKQLN